MSSVSSLKNFTPDVLKDPKDAQSQRTVTYSEVAQGSVHFVGQEQENRIRLFNQRRSGGASFPCSRQYETPRFRNRMGANVFPAALDLSNMLRDVVLHLPP